MKKRTTQRWAILMSTVLCPGVGQWLQGRHMISVVFGLSFLLLFSLLTVETLVPLYVNVQVALALATGDIGPELQPFSIGRILLFFSLAMLVYLVNVMDVMRAARRSTRGLV